MANLGNQSTLGLSRILLGVQKNKAENSCVDVVTLNTSSITDFLKEIQFPSM